MEIVRGLLPLTYVVLIIVALVALAAAGFLWLLCVAVGRSNVKDLGPKSTWPSRM
jgi:hypothetical protein